MLRDAGPSRSTPRGGQPRKHDSVLTLASDSRHTPEVTTHTDPTRYGKAEATAWDRMRPRLQAAAPGSTITANSPHISGIFLWSAR
jgi:hypothetical protein